MKKQNGAYEQSPDLTQLEWPEYLNDKDRELIIEQCRIQGDMDVESVEGFARAYKQAKDIATDVKFTGEFSVEEVLNIITQWAEIIDKAENKGGKFRSQPAHFEDPTRQALDPKLIPRAIKSWAQAYAEGEVSPDELYIEFEKIHPFNDGNGRVGDLLWKLARYREEGRWPYELPPDFFGDENDKDKAN